MNKKLTYNFIHRIYLKKSCCLFGLIFLVLTSTAQTSIAYTFSSATTTYTPLSGGTILSSGATMDDATFNQTLPFTFIFNGTGYSQITVFEDGVITFGTYTLGGSIQTAIGAAYVPLKFAAVLNADLQGQSGAELRTQVLGTAPNRTFVAQWSNLRAWGVSGQSFNFQLTLSETTNYITYTYGNFTTASSNNFQVGLRNNFSTASPYPYTYASRTTTTNWAATTASTAANNTCLISPAVKPVSGTQFIYAANGTALDFDGGNDHAQTTNLPLSTTSFTIEARVKQKVLSGKQVIVANGDVSANGFSIYINPTGKIAFGYGTTTNSISTYTLPLNTWKHITIKHNNLTDSLFIDGAHIETFNPGTNPNPAALSSGRLSIGAEYYSNVALNFLNGVVDEVRIWNRALSNAAILHRATCSSIGNEDSLKASYTFNQGVEYANNSAITTITDLTTNARHLTIVNMALNGATSNFIVDTSSFKSTCSVLPISLAKFVVTAKEKTALLNWQSKAEVNALEYVIERSTNGVSFEKINTVAAVGKANEYTFTDDRLPSTVDNKPLTLYYRLRLVDKDGKYSFSEIKTLNFKPQTSNILVYPNPAKGDKLNIDFGEEVKAKTQYTITTTDGRIVQQGLINNRQETINISTLNPSIYLLKVDNRQVKKIIVQ